jgi:hypothetical protein
MIALEHGAQQVCRRTFVSPSGTSNISFLFAITTGLLKSHHKNN